ncbi:rhodanese-like domain-containing protein [Methylococcus sp. EFPC2]|uniref:rhodanese-like domain-containing protein n=1 Tax=Methylococcus sp. EFPC2 TaxID=2812648 RepID=UPI00196872CE|nr:rhodanese-like domain-containing protein [Methylococcus sp. EFPC2]QSA95999.1 rhodanese-like domain-containing protein [Methylococcus sp. EFPC2]
MSKPDWLADRSCARPSPGVRTGRPLWAAAIFALALSACGFQKPDYVKTIGPLELSRLMQNQDIFLVDVHIPEQRHIKGTDLFIPYNEIEKYQNKLPQDKNLAIYIYCKAGPMGNAAARSLHELGYRNLTNLEGGAEAWKKAGLAIE